MAKIDKVLEEYEQVRQRESELQSLIVDHYTPIIKKLRDNKDRLGLEQLLFSLPDCMVKFSIYGTLREMKNQ